MTTNLSSSTNPAEEAAHLAIEQVYESVREGRNFRLEAGAGAGKTYSLIQALRYIINESGTKLLRKSQKVACISYTKVATNEITTRTDGHPALLSSTIHSFCWSLIKQFQPYLRLKVTELDRWIDKLDEIGGVGQRRVDYQLGHRSANPGEEFLLLGHNDVLDLTVMLMEEKKFRDIFTSRFPILFIDEYQDTNKGFAESIVKHFVEGKSGPLIGLFGDSWQKIYGDGCGLIEHENLDFIGKNANFRSVRTIVDVLDRMRPELPQEVQDPKSDGYIGVYHTNDWVGQRRKGPHWNGDLPEDVAHRYLEKTRQFLEDEGWDFSPERTKILMLTHNLLAAEQKYSGIASSFRYNEAFIKKEDAYISFLIDILEPFIVAFQQGRYGEMFSYLGNQSALVSTQRDKKKWADHMIALLKIREERTIGEMIGFLKDEGGPQIPDAVKKIEERLEQGSQEEIKESLTLTQIENLKSVPYKEVVALADFLNEHTPFSTKHGVKGIEFENVLVVFGRGWNHYNWNSYLELVQENAVPIERVGFFERNRNLFYVTCSRPKKRLALLFTQLLSDNAINTLSDWFGKEAIYSIEELL